MALTPEEQAIQNKKKAQGFGASTQPKQSSQSVAEPGFEATGFDAQAQQLVSDISGMIGANEDQLLGAGLAIEIRNIMQIENVRTLVWQLYTNPEVPSDPTLAKIQSIIQAPQKARMRALTNGLVGNGGVTIQATAEGRDWGKILGSITQAKALTAGE